MPWAGFRFGKGFGATLRRLVLHGVGVHHAGMLPKYRRLVETLAQAGLLAVICGTDTLGVGINVPIRTVLLTSLTKYDGRKQRVLRAREFHQIAGRAGRAGFDTVGYVVVQAPEHVVVNEKALAKAGDDPEEAPAGSCAASHPRGRSPTREATYDRLVAAAPEPLTSKMRVNHAMVLNVLDQWEGQQAALHTLLLDNHEERPDARGPRRARRAGARARCCGPGSSSPTTARRSRTGCPPEEPGPPEGPAPEASPPGGGERDADGIPGWWRGTSARSAQLLAAAGHVGSAEPDAGHAAGDGAPGEASGDAAGSAATVTPGGRRPRALRARRRAGATPRARSRWRSTSATASPSTSRCRRSPWPCSRCSTPRRPATRSTSSASSRPPSTTRGPVLMAQRFEARGEAVGAMKADGMEYEERMDALDDVTWPRPLAEELEARAARLPADGTRGSTRAACRRSRSCARCTSGR